ncbi:MAG: sporulation protein YqfD [Oscillospiraceae bacterium]
MAEKRTGLWLGSVEFHGIGGFPEKMASALMERGVELRRVRFGDGMVSGLVSPADYWVTASTARRFGVRIRAGKRRGLYFTAMKYSRRIGLYIGFLAFIMLTALGESHIQDIEIVSSGTVTAAQRAQVMTILEECGIKEGKSARHLDTTSAERRIMLEVPESSWVDVTCVGFRVEVALETGTPVPELVAVDQPCNLVADRDAVIVDHTVRAGALAAETGSGIPEGGLLVSGVVTDAAGNVAFKHASAEIIGEFTETREFFLPYNDTVQTADGEQTHFTWLVYGDDVYPLFLGEAQAEDAVYTEETEVIRLFGQETPLKLRRGTFTRWRTQDITRSADDCLAGLEKLQADFEQNFYGDYEIYSSERQAIPQEDGIRLVVNYTLRGNIAREQPIELG